MWNRLLLVQVVLRKSAIESARQVTATPYGHNMHKVMFTYSPINVMFSYIQVIYINNKLTWNLLHTFTTVWDEAFIRIREYGGRGNATFLP